MSNSIYRCSKCGPDERHETAVLADGSRFCSYHLGEMYRKQTVALTAQTQRAEAAEQQAAVLRETFNYLLAVADEVARGDASRSALKIAVAQIQSGVAPGQAALAASGGAAPAERAATLCQCGRPLLSPGDADPWCEGCTMSAATCDCVSVHG